MINFEDLLTELGPHFELEGLAPDALGCCLLVFPPEGLKIHLEVEEPNRDQLLIYCEVAHLAPGRYREDLLRSGLRENGKPYPNHGLVAYSSDREQLVLFDKVSEENVNVNDLVRHIRAFLKKGSVWKEAIEAGRIPSDVMIQGGSTGGGEPFGIPT